jgi:hypothetical protein
MPDFLRPAVTPLHIGTFTRWSAGSGSRSLEATSGIAAFTATANQAIYVPLSLPWAYTVRRMWWYNGSTVTTTNYDVGVYTPSGVRIYNTGSQAAGTASTISYATVATPFVLPAGHYYLAWATDQTTARGFGFAIATAADGALSGCLTQNLGSLALPATATFVTFAAVGIPYMGITRTPSGF